MDNAKHYLGLALLTADAALALESLDAPQALISPISSQSRLNSLLQHMESAAPRGVFKVFSAQAPAEAMTMTGHCSSVDQLALSELTYPVSVFLEQPSDGNIQPLVTVVKQLRNPDGGCPWDLEQTQKSLTKYILEEAYEVIEAIQSEDDEAIADELGDLLLQVVLQAQIAREQQTFSLDKVTENITQKLIRRHPHVFGDIAVENIDEVRSNWEAIKAAEQGIDPQDHHQISRRMVKDAKTYPPIIGGMKLAKRAAQAGLEWPNLSGVWAKFYEELAEFQEALLIGREDEQLSELGDLLFTLLNVARWCKLDPSMALGLTNQKLIQRVQFIESQADKPLVEYSLAELDDLWNQAKQNLREG